MTCKESALLKLIKGDLICIALDMQTTENFILSYIKNELSELRKNYNKLKADLKKSRSVAETIENHTVILKPKYWSYEQYQRREYLEISWITSDTGAGELQETVLKAFERLYVDVDPKIVEDFYWLKTRNRSKKLIIKSSERIDANKIRQFS